MVNTGYNSPTVRLPRARVAPAIEGRARQQRRPSHRFNVTTFPYDIQPVALMPVLPGETLKNLMLQAQVWSDPLASGMKNIGWWCEYFVFYVKLTDLRGYDAAGGLGFDVTTMFTTNASMAGYQTAGGLNWSYCYPGAIDWVKECTRRVVDEYFRDEGEKWDDQVAASGVPRCKIYGMGAEDWSRGLTTAAAFADRRTAVPAYMEDVSDAYAEYLAVKDAGLTDMDYDGWMRTYNGGDSLTDAGDIKPQHHKPEDIAHVREFTYPTNTVEPTTGVPATAAGWRVAVRADKRVRFSEPGFVLVLNTVRPKVYLGKQQGAIAGAMQSRTDWLPALLAGHTDIGVKNFAATVGPLGNTFGAAGYYIDLRDLLLVGDQFNNYVTPASGNTGVPFVALPTNAAVRRYAATADIAALFSDTVNGRFRQDGVVDASIMTHIERPAYTSRVLGQT